ncbi:putative Polycomb group protein ASXL2 [Dendronephthya gigantea]|uniref:putative Polycomb group protein ASXL2 n=1 Tax=Dendronephthya gigantea TaxID=151771 RepID=UPI001069A0DC|nr:putative Polycomb group protein ASXL2 [Dendronephthya gigantea]
MDKSKRKGITWGEAAKMVLEQSPEPLNHKEILKAILDGNLKEVSLKNPQALACLNAMLHANSRTPSSLFVKVSGRGTCYRLNKNRTDLLDSSDTDSDSPGSSSNDALSDGKESGERSSHFTGILSNENSTPSCSLPPISSILGSYQSQVTSTSVSSSIACAIADSRLSSLIAPTPDTMPIRSSLSKKRSVKPCFRDTPATKKPRVTFKLDDEKKSKSSRPTRPPVKTKAELKYMGDDTAAVSQNFIPPVLRPPMYPTHTVVKNSSSGYFGQKRHKKMSIAAQVKRSKEGQVDLVSPDSILAKINCRALINFRTFNLLPKHYQYQLVKLLPEVDREVGSKGEIRPTNTAFSNEFFTSAFESWKERLTEGEFTPEMSQKIQQEQEKLFSQDPWKTKHFESSWGEKFMESERYISPVERSHQIMEQVHVEWQKEQERLAKEKLAQEKLAKEQEKLKEAENTDLSAPNKLPKGKTLNEQDAKNLNSKQKAALVRQQKLAKAKSVSNKAHKKTSDGKTSKSGKTASKNGKESVAKDRNRSRPRAKQVKVKSEDNTRTVVQPTSSDPVIDVVSVQATEAVGTASTTVETDVQEQEPKPSTTEPVPISQELSTVPTPISPMVGEQPTSKEKAVKKTSRKKKETKTVNNTLGFPCMCVLKPMVMCRRCGAFCHSDCINPMSVCASCVA